jgi:hypothetical protein
MELPEEHLHHFHALLEIFLRSLFGVFSRQGRQQPEGEEFKEGVSEPLKLAMSPAHLPFMSRGVDLKGQKFFLEDEARVLSNGAGQKRTQ